MRPKAVCLVDETKAGELRAALEYEPRIFLGESGLAATSNANLIMFLMFALGFGFGMAAVILIGQSMGARDMAMVKKVMNGLAAIAGNRSARKISAPL